MRTLKCSLQASEGDSKSLQHRLVELLKRLGTFTYRTLGMVVLWNSTLIDYSNVQNVHTHYLLQKHPLRNLQLLTTSRTQMTKTTLPPDLTICQWRWMNLVTHNVIVILLIGLCPLLNCSWTIYPKGRRKCSELHCCTHVMLPCTLWTILSHQAADYQHLFFCCFGLHAFFLVCVLHLMCWVRFLIVVPTGQDATVWEQLQDNPSRIMKTQIDENP